MDLLPDERAILVALIQIEDTGRGGYLSDPDAHQRLYAKGLERHGKATDLAREILGMPKPAPTADEIATLRTWVQDGEAVGWQLETLHRRGLLDPFFDLTPAGRAALSAHKVYGGNK